MPLLQILLWRSLVSGTQVHPSKGTSGDGEAEGGLPRAGIIEAARVDGRGARRERHFGFGNKKKT